MNPQDLVTRFESAVQALNDVGLIESETWAEGVWCLRPVQKNTIALRLMISLVVHGDETGPLQIILNLLKQWQENRPPISIELILVLGNLEAWALNQRYIEQDMNRLFPVKGPVEDVPMPSSTDAHRALVLRQTLENKLFAQAEQASIPLVHFDLHSTIRPSLKPSFALVPSALCDGFHLSQDLRKIVLAKRIDDTVPRYGEEITTTPERFCVSPVSKNTPWTQWLSQHSGLDALVLASEQSATFSAYTARHGAWSCTVELGQVGGGHLPPIHHNRALPIPLLYKR